MKVAHPPAKPLMIFDGDCGFCRCCIARWQKQTGDRIEFRPFQDPQVPAAFPEIPAVTFAESVVLVQPDGTLFTGAEAVLRGLGQEWLLKLPAARPVLETGYRFIARHRGFLSRWIRVV